MWQLPEVDASLFTKTLLASLALFCVLFFCCLSTRRIVVIVVVVIMPAFSALDGSSVGAACLHTGMGHMSAGEMCCHVLFYQLMVKVLHVSCVEVPRIFPEASASEEEDVAGKFSRAILWKKVPATFYGAI